MRNIFRLLFLLLAVLLLVNLNRKTNNKAVTIAEFKFKMLEKLQKDSLDSKQKVDLLLNETTKFIDDSSQVRKGIHYLMALLALFVISEMSFLILRKEIPANQRTTVHKLHN